MTARAVPLLVLLAGACQYEPEPSACLFASPAFAGEYFIPEPDPVHVRCSESWGNDAPARAAEWVIELPAERVLSIAGDGEGNAWVLTSTSTRQQLTILDPNGTIVASNDITDSAEFGFTTLLLTQAGPLALGWTLSGDEAWAAMIWHIDETGQILAAHGLGQPFESMILGAEAIDDGELLIAGVTGEDLDSIDLPRYHWVARYTAEGQAIWSVPKDARVDDLALTDDAVLVTDGYHVAAYSLAEGSLLWSHTTGTIIRNIAPSPDGGVMFVGYDNGFIAVGQLERDGTIPWRQYHYRAAYDGQRARGDTMGMTDDGQGNVVLTANEAFPAPPPAENVRECMNRWIVATSVTGDVRWADRVEGCHVLWNHADTFVNGRVIIGGALADLDAAGELRERAWVRSYQM